MEEKNKYQQRPKITIKTASVTESGEIEEKVVKSKSNDGKGNRIYIEPDDTFRAVFLPLFKQDK